MSSEESQSSLVSQVAKWPTGKEIQHIWPEDGRAFPLKANAA